MGRSKKRKSAVDNWWSGKWMEPLDRLMESDSSTPAWRPVGQSFVFTMKLMPGQVEARVSGQEKSYKVRIGIRPFDDREWDAVFSALAQNSDFVSQLLDGELTKEIETNLMLRGLRLFPRSWAEVKSDCNCSETKRPCKHVAAVYYGIAQEMDRDPFIIFLLRGRNRQKVLSELRTKRHLAPVFTEAAGEKDRMTDKKVFLPYAIPDDMIEEKPLQECLKDFYSLGGGHCIKQNIGSDTDTDSDSESAAASSSAVLRKNSALSSTAAMMRDTVSIEIYEYAKRNAGYLTLAHRLGKPAFWDSKQDFFEVMSSLYKIVYRSYDDLV